MVGDEVFRQCVSALWALIGSLRESIEERVDVEAKAALEAVSAARGHDDYLLLHEVGGALHVNGRMLRIGMDVFAAATGLAKLFRDRGVGEVMFDQSVDRESLVLWARWQATGVHDADSQFAGIHVSERAGSEVTSPPQGTAEVPAPTDSQLPSMFLQHQLMAAFGPSTSVPPHVARVALGAVANRMLGLAGGMEPLTLLQQDEALLHRSLHVAVFSIVFARVMGWPEERLADLGGAALLHDVGSVLDQADPGRAGFVWLLECGPDEFWLRSAIVARSWRSEHGKLLSDLVPDGSLVAAIVRLAVTVSDCELASDTPRSQQETVQALLAASERGEFPRELADLAVRTIGNWAMAS